MRRLGFPLALLLAVTACGPKRPVLYPNPRYEELGDPHANEIVSACMQKARDAGVAETRTEGAAKGATGGAVVGAVLGGAVGWIFGNPGRGAAAGATHGGGTGAVRGAAGAGESAPGYRGYVEACLREAGLEPVGWK